MDLGWGLGGAKLDSWSKKSCAPGSCKGWWSSAYCQNSPKTLQDEVKWFSCWIWALETEEEDISIEGGGRGGWGSTSQNLRGSYRFVLWVHSLHSIKETYTIFYIVCGWNLWYTKLLLGYPYAINGVYAISMTVFVLTLSITTVLKINPADPSAHVSGVEFESCSMAVHWCFLAVHFCFAWSSALESCSLAFLQFRMWLMRAFSWVKDLPNAHDSKSGSIWHG